MEMFQYDCQNVYLFLGMSDEYIFPYYIKYSPYFLTTAIPQVNYVQAICEG